MSKNEKHKVNIKAWKKEQEKVFLKTVPFSISIFQELFDYLDSIFETNSCKHNLDLTTSFLSSKKIDIKDCIDFFNENGGYCDCEVLSNVEERFPETENNDSFFIKTTTKREKVNSLKFKNLIIESIPSPWKLFKSENEYEFQLGKNKDINIKLIKEFKINDWKNDSYWQNQWEILTDLNLKSKGELIYENLAEFEIITFKTKDWVPVLTWIRKSKNESWGFLFKTELSRFRGDITELIKLLQEIKITTANNGNRCTSL